MLVLLGIFYGGLMLYGLFAPSRPNENLGYFALVVGERSDLGGLRYRELAQYLL